LTDNRTLSPLKLTSLPTIRQIQGFVAVARLKSFSRAARQLGLSQSALSQAIRQLENLVAAQLLQRGTRSVTVTPAGESFLIRAERLLDDLNDAVATAQQETLQDSGSVSVACLSTVATLLVPPVVRRFKLKYPKVSISIRDENVDGIIDQVKAGQVDFAVTCLFTDDPDVEFQPIIHDRFRFVCHRDHPLAGRKSVSWAQLRTIDIVTTTKGSGVRSLIERALADDHVFDNALYEVSRVPSVLRIIEESGVASVLPALSLAPIGTVGPLVHCPMIGPEVHRSVGFLTVKDQPMSTLAAKFQQCFWETLHNDALLEGAPDVRLAWGWPGAGMDFDPR
jgi:DNA-binding transcriptional LysR family regulator